MLKKLIDFLFKRDQFKKVIIVESGKPFEIPKKTLVLTKKIDKISWVSYKCPCGCGETIRLSVSPAIEPYWSISITQSNNKRQLVTITPSIYMRKTKCCSHYFITENKVMWCK